MTSLTFKEKVFIKKNSYDPLELNIFCTASDIWGWVDLVIDNDSTIQHINSNSFKFKNELEIEKFITMFTLKWSDRITKYPSKNENFFL